MYNKISNNVDGGPWYLSNTIYYFNRLTHEIDVINISMLLGVQNTTFENRSESRQTPDDNTNNITIALYTICNN